MSYNEWKTVKISDISTRICSGGTPSRKNEEYWKDGTIPWLKTNQIGEYKIYNTDEYITKLGLDKSSAKLIKKNSLSLAMYGDGVTKGRVSIIGTDLSTNQACCNIEVNKDIADYRFIYYILKQNYNTFRHLSNGGAQQNLNVGMIKEFEIKLPLLEEQEKIANIVSSLDDKIELNNEMNKTLEEMARALFKRWFVDFEFPNENGELYKSSGGEMVESELGKIPKGWEVKQLGEILEKIVDNRGKTPPRDNQGIRLVEGHNITMFNTYINTTSKQKFVSEETYNNWFRAGHPKHLDILCATVGTLPKWCFVAKSDKICIAQNIISLRVNKLLTSPYYLKNYMDTSNFIQMFNGRITTTAQPSIKVGHLTSINIIVPKINITNKYDSIVKDIYDFIENKKIENDNLIKLRDTLLPKLMSGEIRVK